MCYIYKDKYMEDKNMEDKMPASSNKLEHRSCWNKSYSDESPFT